MQGSYDGIAAAGGTIAASFGTEAGAAYTVSFPASRLPELMELYEKGQGITDEVREDHELHGRQHRLLLSLVLDGSGKGPGDWVSTAGLNLVWAALNHPGLGDVLRPGAEDSLRRIGRVTVLFDIRHEALWFHLSDDPIPDGTGLPPSVRLH